jgi:exodeoxyribonuclease V gamma subunit
VAFFINTSNSLQKLAERMTQSLSTMKGEPFTPQWVVTQTEGMKIWLRQGVTRDLGIAANIRFLSPDELVTHIVHWSDIVDRQPMDQETVRWVVFKLLDSAEFKAAHPDTADYFYGNDLKRIALADELADLYDQYQVYRTDIINGWSEKRARGEAPADWQEWIWSALKGEIGHSHSDRAENAVLLAEKLVEKEVRNRILARMKGVHIFGVAILTPYHIDLFHALSGFIDVHLHLLNPVPDQYWLDDVSEWRKVRLEAMPGVLPHEIEHLQLGNELLMNWGHIIRDSFRLLFKDEGLFNISETMTVQPSDSPSTLLNKVKADVFQNRISRQSDSAGGDGESWRHRHRLEKKDITDGSITINSCHTPLREVEALYNHLTALVDAAVDGLSARDILVLVSDIDQYAPYIEAVFGNAPYRFPYTLSDRSVTTENNMFHALQQLLSLDEDIMDAEDVMKLLESPYIRSRFRIADADDLREAVREAKIIGGIEGDRESETRLLSWRYGLKRILYGLCISGESEYSDGSDTLIPLDTAEGSGALDRVRFIHFVNVLAGKMEERKGKRSIRDWAKHLQDLVQDMVFEAGEKDDEDYPRFVSLIEELSGLDRSVSVEVDFHVFRHSFLQRLSRQRRSQSFLGAGITFCSLVPMRSIPFRVVAMLGMGYDKFPRKDNAVAFSEISRNPRLGDRNIRNNDRHLFLETLLSAKESLYISYVGRSEKDGSESPVSSLVDELIDYVARGMDMDTEELRKLWVIEHPLHGFHSDHFNGGPLRNYLDPGSYRTGVRVERGEPQTQSIDTAVIDLGELISFLDNPPRTYFQKQLGVYLHKDELLLPSHETFQLDGIGSWSLKNDLLKVSEEELDSFISEGKMRGTLPLANMGLKVGRETFRETSLVRDMQSRLKGGHAEKTVPIRLDLPEVGILQGAVDNVYDSRLVYTCLSNDIFKYQVRALTLFFAVRATGEDIQLCFIDGKKGAVHAVDGGSVDKEEALRIISWMAVSYRQGLMGFFRFFPDFNKFRPGWNGWLYEPFLREFEKAAGNRFNFDFKDAYLAKAIEYGFLSEEHYDGLRTNTDAIASLVDRFMPAASN